MNFYIHIPFCRQKCPYCKFALTPIFDEAKKRRYIAHLKHEIQEYFEISRSRNIDTIYFGWGTPSVLRLEEVADILSSFEKSGDTEISFECNPEDITPEYVTWLLHLGINRLSIWVQSLNDETLRVIHRSDRESILSGLDAIWSVIATNASISVTSDVAIQVHETLNCFVPRNDENRISINIDFILGLPFSKSGETLKNIRELHTKFPYITHTSVYMLEDGLYPKEWQSDSIDEREIEEEYADIVGYLTSPDWHHYEISNWAKPWYECRHNMWYWDHTNSRGFGLSSTSYIEGKRWEDSHSFSWYYKWERASEEVLTEAEKRLEHIIFAIRTFSLEASLFPLSRIQELEREGSITLHDGKIHLTPTWIFRENTIISRLIEA